MPIIPPIILTTIAAALAALIPKAVSDGYDYLFNKEEIKVRKVCDKTKLTEDQCIRARTLYAEFTEGYSIYKTQQELVTNLNAWFYTNKSLSQMMRICRSSG